MRQDLLSSKEDRVKIYHNRNSSSGLSAWATNSILGGRQKEKANNQMFIKSQSVATSRNDHQPVGMS